MADYWMYRADDGLALRISTDLEVVAQGNGYVFRTFNATKSITVHWPQQHMVEFGRLADGTRPAQQRPIFATGSTISYLVPTGSSIPMTVPGVLAALPSLILHPHPDATSEGFATDPAAGAGVATASTTATSAGFEAPDPADPPRATAAITPTVINLPSRLRLLIAGGATRFVHAADPVTRGGRTELFHARLAVRTASPVSPPQEVTTRAVVDAQTSFAFIGIDPDEQLLDWVEEVRNVDLTTVPSTDTALDLQKQTRTGGGALQVHHLRLTPLGGFAQLSGSWPTGDTESLQHRVSLGRDEKAMVATRGHLFPFGHRAVLSSQMIRRIEGPANGSIAGLTTLHQLIVREPLLTYADGDEVGRQFPWRSVHILNEVSPPGDKALNGNLTYLKVNGEAYRSVCRAVDRAGNTTTFEIPLLFVPDTTPQPVAHAVWAGLGKEFTTMQLRDQKVALAPPPTGTGSTIATARVTAGVSAADAADATAVIAATAALSSGAGLPPPPGVDPATADLARFRPMITNVVGTVPVLEGVAPRAIRTVSFAMPYIKNGFGSANPGEALMAFAGPTIDLGTRAAGLVAPAFQVTGLSRSVGVVSGVLDDIGANQFKPQTWLGDTTLLGIFPLRQLLPASTDLSRAPAQYTAMLAGARTHITTWTTELLPAKQSFAVGPAILSAGDDEPVRLALRVEVSVDPLSQSVRTRAHTQITGAILGLGLPGGGTVVRLPIPMLAFDSVDGAAPDTTITLGPVAFQGPLSFVGPLADLLKNVALGRPAPAAQARTGRADAAIAAAPATGPSIVVLDTGVRAGLVLDVPDIAFGMFSLTDLVFQSQFDLFFNGDAPQLMLRFATFENPFRITVAALGGGGYLMVRLTTKGLQELEGSLDFGAQVSVNLGIAKGSVSITGGVLFRIDGPTVSLAGYLRVRGEVDVLGLISVCLQVTLLIEYAISSGKLEGSAELAFKVKVFMFSKTVKTTFRKQFAGGNADPGFAELMAPKDFAGEHPWDAYCAAFA